MKPLNILVIGCDWRNLFETDLSGLLKKMDRYLMNTDINNFFFFSWADAEYAKQNGERFFSVHKKTAGKKFRPWYDFLSVFSVPRALKKHPFRPDMILVYDLGFLPAAKIVQKQFGGKIVLCLINMPKDLARTRKFAFAKSLYAKIGEVFFIRLADVVYTLNASMKRYIESLGTASEKIKVFSCDTIRRDLAFIERCVRGKTRAKHGIGADKKIILSIGRLEAEKDFPRLFEILSRLDESYVLIVLGEGSLLSEFRGRVEELGISKRVIFAGNIAREELWNYYADADVFMLLSKSEALGLVFWEAMYMGVPVIGSTALGIAESIGGDALRGFLIGEKDDIMSIVGKIEQCVRGGETITQMSKRAREYVDTQMKNNLSINDIIEVNRE
jgi:glycosyltransferase involved in cell wall biosynthesis